MCVLPVTGRSTVGVGGERGDNGDNNDGCSTGSGSSGGGTASGHNSDGGGGSGAGISVTRSNIRSAAAISGADEDINTVSRKGVALDQRHPRHNQGIRKLQKCLSTTTSHFEVESASGATAAFPSISLFCGAQRSASTEMRSYSSAVPQASLNNQNILTSTRQYSSFGSIIDSQF